MERELTRMQAAILGAVVGCVALVFGASLFLMGTKQGWGGETLVRSGALPSAQGLRVGATVRIVGLRVGQVSALEPPSQPGEPVLVRFWIRGEFAHLIREDARLRVAKDGLVGERILEIEPGSPGKGPLPAEQLLTAAPSVDLDQLLSKIDSVVERVRNGEGTLGKFVAQEETYDAAQRVLNRADSLLSSIEESYSNARQNWMLRRIAKDRYALLIRPESEAERKVLAEKELFEPGRSVLTEEGKRKLDEVAEWLKSTMKSDAEILIGAFAADDPDSRRAEITTAAQAEAVKNYLIGEKGIERGWFWWSKVPVTAQGFANLASPRGAENLPARRVEILVFAR